MKTQEMSKSNDLLAEKLELLEQLMAEEDLRANPVGIPRSNRAESLPLSFAQQRLWFLAQLEPESVAYHVPMPLRLKGPLDAAALERALNEIVRRHEVLRVTFTTADGQPVQRIAPRLEIALPLLDLQALPEAQREREALRLAAEEALQPFSLEQGPLLRASLLRLTEEHHVLLLNVHHIAFDGWSGSVLSRELAELYQAFQAGRPSPLTELPIQYADFAIWQRGWLQGAELERQLGYWKSQLAGVSPLELPADHPRPALQSSRGAAEIRLLPKTLLEELRALGRREGATLFMTLLAAFQTLLHRYTGQEDIACGSPIANRNRPEIEGLIGFFVNTLVLRTDLSGNPSFREVLRRVRDVTLEAYSHQDLPFEKLVEVLQPHRDLSRSPVTQVLMSLQNAPESGQSLAGLRVGLFESPVRATRFDLEIHFSERAEGLAAVLIYCVDLFDEATAHRLLGHFGRLLEGLAADPDARVADLPLLAESERQQLLAHWRGAARDYPVRPGIHAIIEEQAARTPEAVALTSTGRNLTYRELNQRANQLAWYLRKSGVGPDVLVGFCLNRSWEMIVAMLGILKAGGAYVPLDPGYPAERLKFMVADTRTPVILTEIDLRPNLPWEGTRTICLDDQWPDIARESSDNPPPNVGWENLAYVMYTSGSTGTPKGVAVRHRGVMRLVLGGDYVSLGPDKTFLQHSPVSFDASTFEIWAPLLHGGRCVLYPGRRTDVAELGRLIRAERVNVLWLTSALFNYIMDEAPDILSPVAQLLVGGEALSVAHVRRALERLPATQLINGYGPTESTTFTCCHAIPRELPADCRSIPLGRPIANTQVYVLDRSMTPVPAGVVGELWIGGDGLAQGYWNRPELTAEQFVPHPWETGAQLYRSGDLVRIRSDGNLEFLGRDDEQVKVRGYRIELGEIESVLGRHAGVKECVVAAKDDGNGGRQLVGYVAPLPGQELGGAELRAHLEGKLPEYMVPSAFVILDKLPLTPNGKVDRRELPLPTGDRQGGSELVAPRDELELLLVKTWEQVLGRQPIGIRDNFFELGGHSLLAVKLFSKIEKSTGTHLPLATLFQHPTVEQLAAVMRQQGRAPTWASLVPIQPGGSRPPLFCVHGAGGNVFFLRDLAGRLGSDQPFYGIQARGLNAVDPPFDRVQDMAEHYLAEVRRLQPQGPYFLAGFCMGGMVAFEMARRLQRDGQEVGLVALLESHGPGYFISPRNQIRFFYEERTFGQRLRDNFRQLRDATPSERQILIWRKFAQLRNRALAPAIQLLARILLWWGHPTLAALKRVHHANVNAQMHYLPDGVYSGRLDLFRAERQPAGNYQYDPFYGWGVCATGGVQVHEFPGYHGTLFQEPYVSVLADKLKERLRASQEASDHKS